jgi:cellulose biosynthesis protein BcsQ
MSDPTSQGATVTTPLIHSFIGAKGGQGTTVVTAAVAVTHARAGRRVLAIDAADHHDLAAVLGVAEPTDPDATVAVTDHLDLRLAGPADDVAGLVEVDDYDVVVIDAGQHHPKLGRCTLVTRCCYLALRRALTLTSTVDDLVVITEPGRALATRDVTSVHALPVAATIRHDPAIARAVDAGVLAIRLPDPLRTLDTTATTS